MGRLNTVCAALLAALVATVPTAVPARADEIAVAKRLAKEFSQAWQVTRGKGATVAVLSSGVDTRVRTLAGAVTKGPDLYKGRRDKRVDGTVLASLIAGDGPTAESPFGIRGLAPAARILSVRVRPDFENPSTKAFYEEGTWRKTLAKGIRYAADHGADVIFVDSHGTDYELDIPKAINHALAKNAVVVGGTDNYYEGIDDVTAAPGVIGVAGLGLNGRVIGKYSARNSSVLVGAPGIEAPSTGPGNELYTFQGSWAASAWVAALAALVRAEYPKLSPAQVGQAIALSAHHPKGGYDVRVGFGMINPSGALKMAGKLAKETPAASSGVVAESAHFSGVRPIEVVKHDNGILASSAGAAGAGVLVLLIALVLALRGRRQTAGPRNQ